MTIMDVPMVQERSTDYDKYICNRRSMNRAILTVLLNNNRNKYIYNKRYETNRIELMTPEYTRRLIKEIYSEIDKTELNIEKKHEILWELSYLATTKLSGSDMYILNHILKDYSEITLDVFGFKLNINLNDEIEILYDVETDTRIGRYTEEDTFIAMSISNNMNIDNSILEDILHEDMMFDNSKYVPLEEMLTIKNIIRQLDYEKYNKNTVDSIYFNIVKKLESKELGYPSMHRIPKPNGKLREIFAYQGTDKILHKMILQNLIVNYSDEISPNVFSYQKGKSSMDAIKYIARRRKNKFVRLIDIKDFFNSVEPRIIQQKMDRIISRNDDPLLRQYINEVILDTGYWDGRDFVEEGPSMKPGSPISSFTSNIIISDLDRKFIGNDAVYLRYADDIILMTDTLEQLERATNTVREGIKEVGLLVNEDKTITVSREGEFTYLGIEIDAKGNLSMSKDKQKEHFTEINNIIGRYKNRNYNSMDREDLARIIIAKINKRYVLVSKGYSRLDVLTNKYSDNEAHKNIDYHIRTALRKILYGKNNINARKVWSNDVLRDLGLLSIQDLNMLAKYEPANYLIECNRILDSSNRILLQSKKKNKADGEDNDEDNDEILDMDWN